MASIYLPQNVDILAHSAGYTTKKFLKEAGVQNQYAYNLRARNLPLMETEEEQIFKFIAGFGETWLLDIYKQCYYEPDLKRYEACKFKSTPSLRPSEDVFISNMRMLRYFFSIGRYEMATLIPFSTQVILRIESGDRGVSDDEFAIIDGAFSKITRYNGGMDVYVLAHDYEILNRIPKNARCNPRKKNTPYNEVNSDNILKGE